MGEITQVSVAHLETSSEWRGGQQQIAYLVGQLLKHGVNTLLICRRGSQILRHFDSTGLPVEAVKIRNPWDILAAGKIAKILKSQGFRILHAHSSHALSLGLLVKMLLPKIILIASRRVDFPVRKPLIGSLKYNNRLVNTIVCVSENVASVLRRCGVEESKITVIHSGIDLNRFSPRAQTEDLRQTYKIPEKAIVVGTVAAMVGHKDYPTLLEAAARVLRHREDAIFCAAGEGPDRGKLERIHAQLELGNRFLFLGFRENVSQIYKLFDIFVLASRMEGLGTAALEAMASGLPVIATSAGGIAEIIVDNSNGLLVPSNDPDALADAIIKLIDESRLRERLAENAIETVSRFSIENTALKHITLYKDLLRESQ